MWHRAHEINTFYWLLGDLVVSKFEVMNGGDSPAKENKKTQKTGNKKNVFFFLGGRWDLHSSRTGELFVTPNQ
jgi:hypothetical protein